MIDIKELKAEQDWAFANVKKRESLYASHGYHRYPAKFIPQLVRKLLEDFSSVGDTVLDPFGGCGTTLVESRLNGRHGISIDVNKVAVLISKAKKDAIDPVKIELTNKVLLERIEKSKDHRDYYKNAHPRLKYWFREEEYNQLRVIYNIIMKEEDAAIRLFYLCCFSNILKNCSIWYAKSIKPMRDPEKKIENPLHAFSRHLKFMTLRNREFFDLIKERNVADNICKVLKRDARKLNLPESHVDLIITSPPYVTSYEYAELHQLSTLWFKYTDDLNKIKKEFVGTSSRTRGRRNINSPIVKGLVQKLSQKSKGLTRHISNYYADLEKCFSEMYRVLKTDKRLCLILGDTEYLGVEIPTTTVAMELLEYKGFKIEKVIKRKLSSKIFTPYRDKCGRFTDANHSDKRKIYQYEYVIVAKK